jgi:hypothetical protein
MSGVGIASLFLTWDKDVDGPLHVPSVILVGKVPPATIG